MPQLSPLNWIFLYVLFWGNSLLMFILVWWRKWIGFSTKVEKSIKSLENKWSW